MRQVERMELPSTRARTTAQRWSRLSRFILTITLDRTGKVNLYHLGIGRTASGLCLHRDDVLGKMQAVLANGGGQDAKQANACG
jgi:hypothetical protein